MKFKSQEKFTLGILYADLEPEHCFETEISDFDGFWSAFEKFPIENEIEKKIDEFEETQRQ